MNLSRLVRFVLVGAVLAGAAAGLHASDRVAVYARVDRVVLTPNESAPTMIQVFGVFAVADRKNPSDYQPPAKGYLYFRLPADERLARREWADLASIAGTPQIVAFGNRYTLNARVRPEKDPPSAPDLYDVDTGLTKINGRTDYAPIRALLDAGR
jgi:hypothetical protein